jgi:HK97 gp10 family phage protein
MSELIGVKELSRKLAGLVEKLSDSETKQVFRAAGAPIRDEARRRAPAGRNVAVSMLGSKRSFVRAKGNLRRSIITWVPRKAKEPTAIVSVQVFKGQNYAPHAHLIEFGTKARRPKESKVLVFPDSSGRKLIFTKRAAAVRPQPFFQPAVAAKSQASLDAAADKTAALLQRFIDRT